MNKYSDNLNVDSQLIESIDNFLINFSNNISFDVSMKLRISKLYLSGLTTPQIRKQKLLTQKYPPKSKEAKILLLYLKPDCNKLYRIRNNSNPEGIIKMIGLQNLCTYILQKYPSPDLAGLPFDNWTHYRLKKYICLLFKVRQNQISEKTISNILSTIYKFNKNKTKDKLPIDISSKRYYLYIRVCKLKRDPYRGKRNYNRCIYAALFQLFDTDIIYTGRKMSKLYFVHKKIRRYNPPTLYKIVDQLLGDEKNSTHTIFIENNSLATFRIASFHALDSLPTYKFILFDFNSCDNVKSVKKLSGKNIDDSIKSLRKLMELKENLDQVPFSRTYQRNLFCRNVSKKITELCGD